MKPSNAVHAMLTFVLVFSACSREHREMPQESLSPEQQRVVGEWFLRKYSDRGSVSRALVFHADGTRFTTTCRSTIDDAVANGNGEGKWIVVDGIVKVKWVERQTVGKHVQNIDYELTLRLTPRTAKQV